MKNLHAQNALKQLERQGAGVMAKNNELVLDVGCGGSRLFEHYKRGFISCDVLKPLDAILNFVQCDAHHLPFKTNLFNKVCMFDVLEHVKSPLMVLLEIGRVLTTKGILRLGTPNALYLAKIVRSVFREWYAPHKSHISTWGKPELTFLLARAGFKSCIEHVTYKQGGKWYYRFVAWLCPFPALGKRQLRATAVWMG